MQRQDSTFTHQSAGDTIAEHSDLKLVGRAIAGDRHALKELWDHHEPKVKAVISSRLRYNIDDVAKVVGRVERTMPIAFKTFDAHTRFSTWICQIADREAASYLSERNGVHFDIQLEDPDTVGMLVAAKRIISKMENREQQSLQNICSNQRSPMEIADSLNIDLQDVYRAVRMFRKSLRRDVKEPNQ